MVEAPIPQDILKYRAKFIGNFSARETICLVGGVSTSLISFFGIFGSIEITQVKVLLSGLLSFPFFAVGFISLYGQPLEKIGWVLFVDNFINPPKRIKEVHYDDFEKWKKEVPVDIEDNKKKKDKKQKATASQEWIGVK